MKLLAPEEDLPGVTTEQCAALLEASTRELAITLLKSILLREHELIRLALIPLATCTGSARLFSPPEKGA